MRTTGSVAAMVVAALLFAAPSAPAAKNCGGISVDGTQLRVRVVSGQVACRTARKVARRATRDADSRFGRWRCDGGAGGFGCTRSSPRARITATVS